MHAILLLQDFLSGAVNSATPNEELFQNYEIFIGDNADFTKNTRCAGGPFMHIDDIENSWWTKNGSLVWNFGKESWCNLEGRYIHIVAYLSAYSTNASMSLCNLGILGSKYVRKEPLESSFDIEAGKSITI